MALGLAATFAASQSRNDPYLGVYRQEVVSVLVERSGRLQNIERQHGDSVEPGDLLCTLQDTAGIEQFQALTAERDRLQDQLDQAVAKVAVDLAVRNDAIEKERLETRLRYADLLRIRLDVQLRKQALQDLDQDPSIASEDRIPVALTSAESRDVLRRLGLADAANDEEVLDTQITLCEERLAELKDLQAALPRRIERSYRVDRLTADLAAFDKRLAAMETAAEPIAISSPAYGRVGVYRRQTGEFAAAGETLVEIFDAERPYVLLSVPISALRELTPDRRVRVEFEGISTRKAMEGTVAAVISDAERDADAARAPGSARAQVKIAPAGRLWPTPLAGSTVRVYLMSESEQQLADKM